MRRPAGLPAGAARLAGAALLAALAFALALGVAPSPSAGQTVAAEAPVPAHAPPPARPAAPPAAPPPARPIGPPPAISPLAAPGDHDGYGRLVFPCSAGSAVRMGRAGDRLTILAQPASPQPASPLPAPPLPAGAPPRNVVSLDVRPGRIEAILAPGSRVRLSRAGGRCLLDAFDPPGAAPAAATTAPQAPPQAPPHFAPEIAALAAALDAPPIVVQAAPRPAHPNSAPNARPNAPPAAAAPTMARSGPDGSGVLDLPFGPDVGAAAFRRGEIGYLVFSRRAPAEPAAFPEPFSRRGAAATLLSDATLIRLRLAPGEALSLARSPRGWSASIVSGALPARPILPVPDAGRLLLAASGAADVVTVPDEAADTLLLVGAQLEPGQAVTAARRMPQLLLPATWQGVVVEPLADTLALHVTPSGFILTATGGLALSDQPGADALARAAALTRRFDLPGDDAPGLVRLLSAQVRDAANAPALARGPARMQAARTMLASGLGAEAQALVRVAVEGDPRLADDPATAALSAVAALLAGRLDEADGLAAPALDGSDEVSLWRAVRTAKQAATRGEADRQAASALAGVFPLALAYAPPLRARLLPLLAETMAGGGQPDAARQLAEQAALDPALALARAMTAEATGEAGAALAAYDALASGADRRMAALAVRRAAELRLAAGTLDAAGAADALDRRRLVWRGDAVELSGRLRAAELRAAAGQWRRALGTLRDAAAWFSDEPEPRRRLAETFAAALGDRSGAMADPVEAAAIAAEGADLIPAGPEGDRMSELMADRLAALGLDQRAGELLGALLDRAPPGPRRRVLGLRLALVRLRQDDAAGALAALARSADDVDAPGGGTASQERALAAGRALAQLGRTDEALAALAPLRSPQAAEARASVLEQTGDWPGALAALTEAAQALPAAGLLDAPGASLVLRLAEAAARVGEPGDLERIHDQYASRLAPGAQADMFQLLTGAPVASTADLPRAARETATARALAGR